MKFASGKHCCSHPSISEAMQLLRDAHFMVEQTEITNVACKFTSSFLQSCVRYSIPFVFTYRLAKYVEFKWQLVHGVVERATACGMRRVSYAASRTRKLRVRYVQADVKVTCKLARSVR